MPKSATAYGPVPMGHSFASVHPDRRHAQAVSELRGLEDRTEEGHERGIRERGRRIERYGDGPIVDGIHGGHVRKDLCLDAAGVRRGAVLPGH